MVEASSWSNRRRQVHVMIHVGAVEKLQGYGHLIKVVDDEPGMTGNSFRPSAVVVDFERGRMWAGGDVYRPALA